MDEVLKTERRGAVLSVTLDRPKANAIDAATSRRMGETFASFHDDPDLRVAVFTGGGDKFFSADWGVGGFAGLQQLPGLNKPVIAAVNGMAVGANLGGITQQAISKLERGSEVTGSQLTQLSHILGVPVSYFFDGLSPQDMPGDGREPTGAAGDTGRRRRVHFS